MHPVSSQAARTIYPSAVPGAALRDRVGEERLYASVLLSDVGGGCKFRDGSWETVSLSGASSLVEVDRLQ